jgi:phosphoglycolate phosphatase-like HAD superfamily hydrolase
VEDVVEDEVKKLVLFDIDGTLLRAGGQAGRILLSAIGEVYGSEVGQAALLAASDYDFAGRTDPRITLDLLATAGLEGAEASAGLDELRTRYGQRLAVELDPTRMRLLPGVREILALCAARDDLELGLLTGNWEIGARAKLAPFGLNEVFPFGAFGDDGTERWELPPAALARAAARLGAPVAAGDVLIIGDTLHDVECGRVHGLAVLAVATGRWSCEQLRGAGARWALSDLAAIDLELWSEILPSHLEKLPTKLAPPLSAPAMDRGEP